VALVLAWLAILVSPARASTPLVVTPERGAAPVELAAEAGGFVGRFVVENRGAESVRATVRARPGSTTLPRLPASLGVAFEGGRSDATLAPGQKLPATVRWVVREPSPQQIHGQLLVEAEGHDAVAIGVSAQRPRTFWEAHALSLLLLLPLLGIAALVVLHFARYEKQRNLRLIVIAVALGQLAIGAVLYTSFDVGLSRYHGGDGFQFVRATALFPSLGIQYLVGIDGVSVALVLLVPVVLLISALLGDAVDRRLVAFWCWMLALELGVLGALVLLDLALFLVAWLVASVAVIALVGGWSIGNGRPGTRTAIYFALSGGLITLAFFVLAGSAGTTYLLDGSVAPRAYSYLELLHVDFLGAGLMSAGTVQLAWVALFVGFAIPLAAVPLHGWLIAALRSAPAPVGMLLVGGVAPLGVYGIVRFGYGLLPEGTVWASTTVGVLGIVGALWAALSGIAERDLARFAGYATAMHAGLALLALSGLTGIAIESALAQAVGNGLAAVALTAVVGALRSRVGHADSSRLGGLFGEAPLLSGLAAVAFFGSMAIPGSLAFVGQAMAMVGAFAHHPALVLATALVLMATGAAHVSAFSRAFFGEVPEALRGSRHLEPHGGRVPELDSRELVAFAVPAALIVALGFAPQLLLRLTDSSSLDYAERVSPPGPTEVAQAPGPAHDDRMLALNSPRR
jgi:NADH-quinone oxidoreductase subunit M